MHERYEYIKRKLKEAKTPRQISIWRNKLEKWQLEYGAYAPVRR